jgi:hypothetical protein
MNLYLYENQESVNIIHPCIQQIFRTIHHLSDIGLLVLKSIIWLN